MKFLIDIFICYNIALIGIKTSRCVNKVLDEEPYLIKTCPDRCKTREVCKKSLHCRCPSALRYAPDWLVTPKKLKDVDNIYYR